MKLLPAAPMQGILAALMVLIGLHQLNAQNFVLTSSPKVGHIPIGVVAADINADGKLDLISADLDDNTLTVLTNNGNGIFTHCATLPVGNSPLAVVATDVNHSGGVDLICANGGDDTLIVLTNNGDGVFGSNATYTVGNSLASAIAADMNGDGHVDLICANLIDHTLGVLTNDGAGRFILSSTNSVGRYPLFVAAADLNGDNKMDLVSVNWGDDTITVLTNDGASLFGSNATYAVGSFPESLVVADVNGDSVPDLICANGSDNTLSVLTNDGSGGFALGFLIPTGSEEQGDMDFGPESITAADVNYDGSMDLIYVEFNDFYVPGTLTVLTNDGTGSFTVCPVPSVGSGPSFVVAADLNGDSKLDLVTANHLDHTLSVLIYVPRLQVNALSNYVVISWPASWNDWTLQQNANLNGTNWSNSDNISNDGTNRWLNITALPGSLFFRLSHP